MGREGGWGEGKGWTSRAGMAGAISASPLAAGWTAGVSRSAQSTRRSPGQARPEVELIDLTSQIDAEAVVRLLFDQREPAGKVDAAGGGGRVGGPQVPCRVTSLARGSPARSAAP